MEEYRASDIQVGNACGNAFLILALAGQQSHTCGGTRSTHVPSQPIRSQFARPASQAGLGSLVITAVHPDGRAQTQEAGRTSHQPASTTSAPQVPPAPCSQSELGLGRDELAALAQLLGGDYCEGVAGGQLQAGVLLPICTQHAVPRRQRSASGERLSFTNDIITGPPHPHPPTHPPPAGVGIVNAVEVVHAFRGPEGLRRFREWLAAPDEALVQLARGTAGGGGGGSAGKGRGRGGRKGRGKAGQPQEGEERQGEPEEGGSQPDGTPSQQHQQREGRSQPEATPSQQEQQEEGAGEGEGEGGARLAEFKRRHRGVRRNWEPPPSFPSAAVEQAYAQPKVDASKDK